MHIQSNKLSPIEIVSRFVALLAHCRQLSLSVKEVSDDHLLIELPYSEQIVGYPETGVIHGGVITTLMDTASGSVVVSTLQQQANSFELCPTLDLRVDYMKPAEPNKPVLCYAQCYKVTSNIAFTRAIAYQDSIDNPIAHGVGSFMRISTDMDSKHFQQALLNIDGDIESDVDSVEHNKLTTSCLNSSCSLDVAAIIQQAAIDNDFTPLITHVPYAQFIGMQVERFGDELVFRLPAKAQNIGNPTLPAIHGGVIAGFMEMSAIVQLMVFIHSDKVPKVVDFSIDYLRAGHDKETYAECRITRQGRRVANVNISCWQTSKNSLIATARAHFLIG